MVIFDLDGTLTQTSGVDTRAFVATCHELWGDVPIDTTWGSYRHATDHGCLAPIFEQATGRGISEDDVTSFRERFAARLIEEGERAASVFQTIPGAVEAIAALRADSAITLALATGCFEVSARIKMRFAGLDLSGLPAGYSEDGPSREGVLRAARRRAGGDAPVVYVGDAVWDARTCRALGWPLVGRATGERADRLRSEGVTHVLADLTDLDALHAALADAGVPRA